MSEDMESTHLMLATVVLGGILVAGTMTDLRSGTLPNRLTATGLVLGLAVSLIPGGVTPVQAVLSILIAFAAGFPFYLLRAMGAGDVKFLMAAGSFFAPANFGRALVLIALTGAVVALVVSWRSGALKRTLGKTGLLVVYMASGGRYGARSTLGGPDTLAIPYGVAIALGAGLAWIGVVT
jgi:prepilin peptidase CpaA